LIGLSRELEADSTSETGKGNGETVMYSVVSERVFKFIGKIMKNWVIGHLKSLSALRRFTLCFADLDLYNTGALGNARKMTGI
jgi:hypothetical protein